MELPVRLTLEQIAQYDAATELWQASLLINYQSM